MAFKFLSRGSIRGEKAVAGTSFFAHMTAGSAVLFVLRFFQFIMGIVVIGLYAQDLDRAHKAGVGYDGKWMYATIVGTLGSFYSLLCMFPLFKSWYFFIGDWILVILFSVADGIFGKMYQHENPEGDKGIVRMKNAVWILLVNVILWLLSAGYGAFVFWKSRKARTTLSGRAQMHV